MIRTRVKRVETAGLTAAAAAARKRGVIAMTEAARMDTLPYVPRLEGHLARTADTESRPERGLLIYGSPAVPYARRQYYGLPRKGTTRHPRATMQWFEASRRVNARRWERVMAAEYKRL